MDNNVTFYKPNELIAVIEQVQVSRLAKHLCNYLLKYAQEQIKFNNHKGNQFVINIYDVNSLANVGSKDYNLIDNALKKLMQPVTVRDRDNPNKIKHLVPIYEILNKLIFKKQKKNPKLSNRKKTYVRVISSVLRYTLIIITVIFLIIISKNALEESFIKYHWTLACPAPIEMVL